MHAFRYLNAFNYVSLLKWSLITFYYWNAI